MTTLGHVTGLRVYPLKGAGGIELEQAGLDPRGLLHDRRWMLVHQGVFLSQRSHPMLALLRPRLEGESLRVGMEGVSGEAYLPPMDEGERLEVEVWGDRVEAVAPSPEADAWFSELLGLDCRAVRMPAGSRRPTDPAFAPGSEVSFADGYPLLMVSEGSLRELNRRLDEPLGMERFRPNLIVAAAEGWGPHAEDDWPPFTIGDTRFRGVKPCARCVVTTIDQETGEAGREPLRTLASYRERDGKVWFGQNLVHEGEGPVRVGDPLVRS